MQDKESGIVGSQASATFVMRVQQQSASTVMQIQNGSGSVAKRLEIARQIALTGAAKGEALFDGSKDVAICTVLETLSNEEMEGMLI